MARWFLRFLMLLGAVSVGAFSVGALVESEASAQDVENPAIERPRQDGGEAVVRIDSKQEGLDRWLADLASDSYLARQAAKRRLFQHALESEDSFRSVVVRLLPQEGSPSTAEDSSPAGERDLELALAKRRLLAELRGHWRELTIDRFIYDPQFDVASVDGWNDFSRFAGDTLPARLVYADALRHHAVLIENFLSPSPLSADRVDLEQLDRRETTAWAIVLAGACREGISVSETDLFRLSIVLRCPGTGPLPIKEHERAVIVRLVGSYLERPGIDVRDRIVIAARYGCDQRLQRDCRSVLDDPSQTPSRIVTALLAASACEENSEQVDGWIENYRSDARVSHVWRSMTPPKSTHRVQVRDVALALRWHREGVDPRTRGFEVLAADPVLVFQPYSLGFENEHDRATSHRDW